MFQHGKIRPFCLSLWISLPNWDICLSTHIHDLASLKAFEVARNMKFSLYCDSFIIPISDLFVSSISYVSNTLTRFGRQCKCHSCQVGEVGDVSHT